MSISPLTVLLLAEVIDNVSKSIASEFEGKVKEVFSNRRNCSDERLEKSQRTEQVRSDGYSD